MSVAGVILGLLSLIGTGVSAASSASAQNADEAQEARAYRKQKETYDINERERRRTEQAARRAALSRAHGGQYPYMPAPSEPGVTPLRPLSTTPQSEMWGTLGALAQGGAQMAAQNWGAYKPTQPTA